MAARGYAPRRRMQTARPDYGKSAWSKPTARPRLRRGVVDIGGTSPALRYRVSVTATLTGGG